MDFFDTNDNSCRICLSNIILVNWNEEIFELCGMTYRDCYFKYTQLEEIDPDPFSSMLCKKCSKDLRDVHFFIENALETFQVLQHAYQTDALIDKELKGELTSPSDCGTGEQEDTEEFEVCLLSQSHESLIDIENSDCINIRKVINFEATEENSTEVMETLDDVNISQSAQKDIADSSELIENQHGKELQEFKDTSLKSKRTLSKTEENPGQEFTEKLKIERLLRAGTPVKNDPAMNTNRLQSLTPPPGEQKKKRKKNEPLMCEYCSQILVDIYSLKKHEAIHNENRERKEVCSECGLRFYSKMSLRCHMLTHEKNREKPYKCEFCEKAYFNRGALNVHRRIHLGLMKKCTHCPKEFCRQIDLDHHLRTHATSPFHANSKQPKIYVHCKDCDSQIPSRRWKAHLAAHRNEPQVKCTICNKDFYSRKNCTKHINKIHNKTKEEYDKYMHFYVEKSEMRMSHLMLQQTAEIIKK